MDTEDHDTFTWKEADIYGSSRLGLYNADKVLVAGGDPADDGLDANEYTDMRGKRSYELSNHLGNVLVVISDKRTGVCDDDEVVAYDAEILDATDYYAFGSPMPGRQGIIRCHIEPDTTITNVYDINETFTGTSNVGAFAPVSPSTTLTNTGGNEMLVTSTVTQPITNVMFTMVNGRNYTISTDLKNMSSLPPGYTTSVLCEIMVAGFPIASGSMTANGSTYSFNFTGTTNGTAYVQYTFVIVSPPPFPPPPPIFPPYFFAIDNVRLYYVSTTYSSDTICVLDRNGYRYGFNGYEKDNEIAGEENTYAAEFWEYDSRIGRRWNIDPLTYDYPGQSSYSTFNNNPIYYRDPSGAAAIPPKDQQVIKTAAGGFINIPATASVEKFGITKTQTQGGVSITVDANAARAFTIDGKRYVATFSKSGVFLGYYLASDMKTAYTPEAILYEKKVSAEFKTKLLEISYNLGHDPNKLMAVMAQETGETFRADIWNGKTAVGLIQFTSIALEAINKQYGTKYTKETVSKLTAIEQLALVQMYFQLPNIKSKTIKTIEDYAIATFSPANVGKGTGYVLFSKKSVGYRRNKGLDTNKDGKITIGEVGAKYAKKYVTN